MFRYMSNAFENILNSQERDKSYLIRNLFGNESNFENEVRVKIAECQENKCVSDEKELLKSLLVVTDYNQLSYEEKEYLEKEIFNIKRKRDQVDDYWEKEAKRAGFSSAEEYRVHLKDNDL